jgi:hypothetical protein
LNSRTKIPVSGEKKEKVEYAKNGITFNIKGRILENPDPTRKGRGKVTYITT